MKSNGHTCLKILFLANNYHPQEGTLVKAESVESVSTDLQDIYGMY